MHEIIFSIRSWCKTTKYSRTCQSVLFWTRKSWNFRQIRKTRQLIEAKIKSALHPVPWSKQQYNHVSLNRRLSRLKQFCHLKWLCWIIHKGLVHQNLSCFLSCLVVLKLQRNFLRAWENYLIILGIVIHHAL